MTASYYAPPDEYIPFDPPKTRWTVEDQRLLDEENRNNGASAKEKRRPNLQAVPDQRGPFLLDPATLTMKDPKWLIRHLLPDGALTILQGHGGTNKGTWALQQAARVTRGEVEDGKPGFVLISAVEDEYEEIVLPRLTAAKADLTKVRFVGALTLPDDSKWVQETIREHAARLLVVDPLLSHLSGKVDSYRDHDVKLALAPVVEITQTGCTVLGVHHFTKNTDKGAFLSGQASGAFGNTSRVVLGMAKHDEDEDVRVIEVVKSNIGPTGYGRQLRMKLVTLPELEESVPILSDEGKSERTVDEILAASKSRAKVSPTKLQALVLEELTDGPKSREQLNKSAAEKLKASADQLYRHALQPLKDEATIKAGKEGFDGGFFWSLTST